MEKKPPRSFNTVKNSNREARMKRQKQERTVLLAILSIAILIALILAIFLVASLADTIGKNLGNDGDKNDPVTLEFTQMTQKGDAVHSGDLIVINQKDDLEYVFPTNPNLVLIDDIRQAQNGENPYQTKYYRLDEKMQYVAAHAANNLLTDFYLKYNDNSLIFGQTHRSKEEQTASGSGTPAGFSEHHTGLVFTLYAYNEDGKRDLLSNNVYKDWIYENAHKYGIICRYPADKTAKTGIDGYDYCFRYVGVAHATYIYENGLCLEEYVELLKNYTADAPLKVEIKDQDGKVTETYAVYYTAASTTEELTTVSVPKDFTNKTGYTPANKKDFDAFLPAAGEYTVSGDNIGGFVVTVNLTPKAE